MRHANGAFKAVVLAAGKGVRLWPLTENRSKHMIPIAGRPIIEHVISAIKSAGIRSLVVVTQYRGELIKKHIGDGAKLGVTVEYVNQADVSGTANAISVTKDRVGSHDFLVVYGDLVVSPRAIRRVVDAYRRKGGKPTVGLVPVMHPESYGMAKTSGDRLIEIIEKPDQSGSPTNLANTGIYVLNPSIFDHLERTVRSGRGEFEITDTISSMARSETPVTWTMIEKSDWLDIGRPWEALLANAQLLARSRRRSAGKIEKGAKIIGQRGDPKGGHYQNRNSRRRASLGRRRRDFGAICTRACRHVYWKRSQDRQLLRNQEQHNYGSHAHRASLLRWRQHYRRTLQPRRWNHRCEPQVQRQDCAHEDKGRARRHGSEEAGHDNRRQREDRHKLVHHARYPNRFWCNNPAWGRRL